MHYHRNSAFNRSREGILRALSEAQVRSDDPRAVFSCRACETIVQAQMPTLPIEKGRPGPALLAHVLVAKYCDHLPLQRKRCFCTTFFASGRSEILRCV